MGRLLWLVMMMLLLLLLLRLASILMLCRGATTVCWGMAVL